MKETLSEVRDRLHRKAQEYFTFDHGRRDKTSLQMFYGATDALLDAGAAASSYDRGIGPNLGVNLLCCYGFLQAIYVQQDAVITLSRAVGLGWNPQHNERLGQIRDIRDRLTGHPARRDRTGLPSSAILVHRDISGNGFRGHIYYEGELESVFVDVAAFLADNEAHLVEQMKVIEQKMDAEESEFREARRAPSLSSHFEDGFSYLLARLRCNLTDQDRVEQARAHLAMLRETLNSLQSELTERSLIRMELAIIWTASSPAYRF